MRDLSFQQTKYRYYLQSDTWKSIRQKALEFYGTICCRCGEHGTDVHHKTYERVGGQELMEDLEVMCRSCHDAYHRVQRAYKKKSNRQPSKKKRKGIHERALRGYLTSTQKDLIKNTFSISSDSDMTLMIMRLEQPLCNFAAHLLGFDFVYRDTGRTFYTAAIEAKKRGKKYKLSELGKHGITTEGYK